MLLGAVLMICLPARQVLSFGLRNIPHGHFQSTQFHSESLRLYGVSSSDNEGDLHSLSMFHIQLVRLGYTECRSFVRDLIDFPKP